MYVEPESPNEGACLSYTTISAEAKSPKEGVYFRYVLNRNRQMRGQFTIYDEAESPTEGACFRYMMIRNRQTRGACLGCMLKRNRRMRGRV